MKKSITGIIIYSFLLLYLVVSLYPLLYLLFISLKNNSEIFLTNPLGFPNPMRFSNYLHAVQSFNIPLYFRNSLIVTTISIMVLLVFSLTFSYAAARLVWRGSRLASNYIMVGLFIPTQVILIPLAVLVRDMNIANTHTALILPYIAFNLAFSTMIFYGFFRTIPFEIEESAYIDGASIYRTFVQIMLPLMRPAIATVTIFAFLSIWNEYPIALILITNMQMKTLPTGLLSFTGQFSTDWGPMAAAMVLASIPMITVYLILGNQVERALSMGAAVKG